MDKQQPQKEVRVKKSSIQLDPSEEIDLMAPKKEESENQILAEEQERAGNDNLLDLDTEKNQFDLQSYKQFLNNRVIVIEGPQLITENVLKSYKLYKIKSRKKDSQSYDTCVSRRYSDFQYLQKTLIEQHGGCIIPLLPEKNFWANINLQGEQFAVNRTKNLQKYLRSLLQHQKLRCTGEIRNFLFFDEAKFSQGKGDFFSKIKTQDKVKSLASNAYNFGLGIYSKYFHGKDMKFQELPKIIKPTLEDLKLMEYQRDVQGLVKVITVLRQMVENSIEQMRIINQLEGRYNKSQEKLLMCNYQKLKMAFEDVSQYILSCNDALNRRNAVRIQIDQLTSELQGLQKKIKSNPRSQQVDITRNKLARASEKCEKWTNSLLNELQKSVTLGKSMVESFIEQYTQEKEKFYNS